MAWELENDRPIYLQLIEKIKLLIISGEYPAGSKFPSVRDLALEAAVNPNTMQKALSELEREGLVITNRTSGRLVTEDEKMIEELRIGLAREKIEAFLAQMEKLGFTKEEIKELLDKNTEE